jgi:hypothetical protein
MIFLSMVAHRFQCVCASIPCPEQVHHLAFFANWGVHRAMRTGFCVSWSYQPNFFRVPSLDLFLLSRLTAWAFFANWASVILVMLTAQSLGLLVGALVTNPKIGQTIVSVLALSMVLVSRSFHPNLSWITRSSFNLSEEVCALRRLLGRPSNHFI